MVGIKIQVDIAWPAWERYTPSSLPDLHPKSRITISVVYTHDEEKFLLSD